MLSCFANIRVKDEVKIHNTDSLSTNSVLKNTLNTLNNVYEEYLTEESRNGNSDVDNLNITLELVVAMHDWCNSPDEQSCKFILQKCEIEYEIFTGEFIKAILKINNMVNELKSVAEYMSNVDLLHKLSLIPDLTLKFIATNQSLYI